MMIVRGVDRRRENKHGVADRDTEDARDEILEVVDEGEERAARDEVGGSGEKGEAMRAA